MFDLIKKTMLTGVGLAIMAKDKVEDLAVEIAEKGKMSEKEGKKFIDDLLKKSEQAKKDLDKKVEDAVRKTLKKMDIVTGEDIAVLEERIKGLEQKEVKIEQANSRVEK